MKEVLKQFIPKQMGVTKPHCILSISRLLFHICLLLFLCIGTRSMAQIPTPKYIGEVALVNEDSSITALDKTQCKMKAVGRLGGAKSVLIMDGARSSVRLPKNSETTFIIRYVSNNVDPISLFKVHKLESTKKNRKLELLKVSVFGSTNEAEVNTVRYTADPYGKDCYIIRIDTLEEGEYCVRVLSSLNVVYCFGVD